MSPLGKHQARHHRKYRLSQISPCGGGKKNKRKKEKTEKKKKRLLIWSKNWRLW